MKNIIVEKRNRIGIVTVNRPNELNSMNSETRKELAIAFEELDLDDDVNVSIHANEFAQSGTPEELWEIISGDLSIDSYDDHNWPSVSVKIIVIKELPSPKLKD